MTRRPGFWLFLTFWNLAWGNLAVWLDPIAGAGMGALGLGCYGTWRALRVPPPLDTRSESEIAIDNILEELDNQ